MTCYLVGMRDHNLENCLMVMSVIICLGYYKYSEAAILVFSLDRPDTFHVLAQHLLDIVTYAENGKLDFWLNW